MTKRPVSNIITLDMDEPSNRASRCVKQKWTELEEETEKKTTWLSGI